MIRHGRLAAAGTSPLGTPPRATLDLLLATAETVPSPMGELPIESAGKEGLLTPRAGGDSALLLPGVGAEEMELLHTWLERPETRLVSTTTGWASRANSAGRWSSLLAKAQTGQKCIPTTGRLGSVWIVRICN